MIDTSFPHVKHDLQTRFGSIYGDEERQAVLDCLARDAPTSASGVVEFEKEFAAFCGTKHAIAVSNGTAALLMAFKAVDIKPGDEIITTPVTWIATAAAAEILGARTRFCDVDATMSMDPATIAGLISEKTKAIVPVHLYGQPVDFGPIKEIADARSLPVIEDACHAPGATYRGKPTGSLGTLGCFSFHEQKNMSTLGEGGMVTTNDDALAERVRLYKSHCTRVIGPSTKYLSLDPADHAGVVERNRYWFQDFDDCGFNVRMTDMQGVVGSCQLKKLPAMNKKRGEIARVLGESLATIDGISPLPVKDGAVHVYHLYPVMVGGTASKLRDKVVHGLHKQFGIRCGVHYIPLVHATAFKQRGHSPSECPVACKQWERLLTLPCHPRMEASHVDYLSRSIKAALDGARS